MRWQPIHPSKSPANTELPGRIAPVRLQETDPYTGLSLSSYNFNLSTMMELDFNFGKTKGEANVHYFMLEIACYKSGIQSVTYEDGRVAFTRRGIGIRVGVACWDVSFEASSNLAAVAASVAIKGAKSSIIIQALGDEAIKKLTAYQQMRLLEGFTTEAIRLIGTASEQVVDLFVNDPNVEPADMQIASFDLGIGGQIAAALSMQFANEQVFRGNDLTVALAKLIREGSDKDRKYFHPVIAQAAYAGYGIRSDIDPPSQEQKDKAKQILMLGR